MRKLMLAAISFSAAILLSQYFIPPGLQIFFALGLSAVAVAGMFFKNKYKLLTAIVVFSIAAGFIWNYFYYLSFYSAAEKIDGKTLYAEATVLDYSKETDYGANVTVSIKTDSVRKLKAILYIMDPEISDLSPGDKLAMNVNFSLPDKMYDKETNYYTSNGYFLIAYSSGDINITHADGTSIKYIPQYISRAFEKIISEIFPEDSKGFVTALVIGDRELFNDDTALKAAFLKTGLLHIVAVSGMHIVFLTGFVSQLVRKKKLAAIVTMPVIFLFMAICGFSASVARAGIMQMFLLTAPLLKRDNDSITAISAALMILLIINPYSVCSVGLQLSFVSTLGIILFTPKLFSKTDALLKGTKIYSVKLIKAIIRFIISSFATTTGASIFTVGLVAVYFGNVSLVALFANLCIIWAVSAAFCGGIIACVAGFILKPAGIIFAKIVSLPVKYIIYTVKLFSSSTLAAVYTDNILVICWLIYIYALIVLFFVFRCKLRKIILPVSLAIVSLCALLLFTDMRSDSDKLSVTALDVGQGQSIVITSGANTVMVDCGGAKDAGNTAGKYLLSSGRDNVELLILTHFHEDHANGVEQLLQMVNVSTIAMPYPTSEDDSLAGEVLELASTYDIETVFINSVTTAAFDDASIKLYYLSENESKDENENGLIVLCSKENFDVLITGDVNYQAEQSLLSNVVLSDIELLVAGHHGSKYSTCEDLLAAAAPEFAIISVGYNTYGHPAPETLERLEQADIEIYRTDILGNITINAG